MADKVKIRISEDTNIDEILGNPPSWLLKWGISIIFLTTFIFGILSWYIKYPDTIQSKITILTKNPPIKVVARANGSIENILVQNNQFVKQGDLILTIKNTANESSIRKLEQIINKTENIQAPKNYQYLNTPNLLLGDLQEDYNQLVLKIKNHKISLKEDKTFLKINSLKNQIIQINKLIKNLKGQKQSFAKEFLLVEKNYARSKTLYDSKVISDANFESIKMNFIKNARNVEHLNNQIIQHQMNIERINSQIIEMNETYNMKFKNSILEIENINQKLKVELQRWHERYQVTSPIDGQVSFTEINSKNQYLKNGQEILTIVPEKGKIIGKAYIPSQNSGKLKFGQNAQIDLIDFPKEEFGIIHATVNNISLTPVDNKYLLEFKLRDSLITSYGKSLKFKQEMTGNVKIITEERRAIERIFDSFFDILKNR